MKKDEAITGLAVAWTVERYVKVGKAVEEKESKTKEEREKKAAPKKTPAISSQKGKKKTGKKK
jgi:hypothetical protein